MTRVAAAGLCLVLALAACGTAPEPMERRALSSGEIEETVAGRTLVVSTTDGNHWEADFSPDAPGVFGARWSGGGSPGVWAVRDDRLCMRLEDGRDVESCRPVVRVADVAGRPRYQILDEDGSVRHSFTVR